MACTGCERDFRPDDCAPIVRYGDRTFDVACRYCITLWIKEGFLYKEWPFWARKKGLDQMGLNS
jgi:hypothetical protein